ncbi:hypothetical protein [Bradyrhizobium sp.]|uniref:hypothetical protein n=1 Tax=Bradyrhizobium sp. TaxID=376 RepID=UPI0025BB8998|nr:hypothetical protein [Bradyrhizobium sp.]
MRRSLDEVRCWTAPFTTLLLASALPLAQPASAQQAPTFFFMTNFEALHTSENGGSAVPARGANANIRPIAGLTGKVLGDATLTVLGGASATRYSETPRSDADSLFAMANLSRTVGDYKFGASFLFANSQDPTFAVGVAKTYDTTLSISRAFTPEAFGGWSITPQLKASRRNSDALIVERWAVGASIEASRPAFGGRFTISGGYDWLDYVADGRHDDAFIMSSSWLYDLDATVQYGLKADAVFAKSNVTGKSVDSFSIGPTLRVLFAK